MHIHASTLPPWRDGRELVSRAAMVIVAASVAAGQACREVMQAKQPASMQEASSPLERASRKRTACRCRAFEKCVPASLFERILGYRFLDQACQVSHRLDQAARVQRSIYSAQRPQRTAAADQRREMLNAKTKRAATICNTLPMDLAMHITLRSHHHVPLSQRSELTTSHASAG
ncbi:hypothetical protein [Xanthomonas campestris]|uniref:hypothetical protein n=2 Tax=Xanthomonas campestris TaxID=339 RepID=UPI0013B3F2B7|nr:hypothetical protein [Xanthomonas campestris]WDI87383.1 hypothetical protein JH281_09925 [Xanthomonas campestris pv. campestris]WDJ14044.1 hypothetical protein JH272_20910 [Xanthomonas campestris pv. campestris]WVL64727.1 hypothetical protein VDQ57_020530 [Xanthomonas campestris pv. campestris]